MHTTYIQAILGLEAALHKIGRVLWVVVGGLEYHWIPEQEDVETG